MASESWTLKVEFQEERRRLKDWVPVGEEPTVEGIRSGAVRLFEIPGNADLILQYQDNEGDVCTLTEMTLPDALCLAVESRTLRVMVSVREAAQAEAEHIGTTSAVECVRAGLQDGGARLRTSLEQLGTSVSSSLQNGRINAHAQAEQLSTSVSSGLQEGVEQFRTRVSNGAENGRTHAQGQEEQMGNSVSSALQDGRIRAQAQQFGANIQESGARLRATVGQISSEIQTNLQEGREGFKTRSEQLSGELREGSSQFRQSLTKSVDGLMSGENSPESSKARVASAVVAGGATLVVTRSLPLAITLSAIIAGAAGVKALRGGDTQESAGPDNAGPTVELPASDAEELIDSDVISLPGSNVGESIAQDMQTAVVEPSLQAGEEEDEDGMVLVHAENGSVSGHSSEAAAE